MACDMVRTSCGYFEEKTASFVQKVYENTWMNMPFVSSGAVSTLLTCAIKVVGCATPIWTLFQGVFASCAAAHSAFISPLQPLPTERTTVQSVIKSTLHVAWVLRAGVINALVFDAAKHFSLIAFGPNPYLLCFWDVASVVALLPIIANPLCGFSTGVMIVAGVAVVSPLVKYIGEKAHAKFSLEQFDPIPESKELVPIERESPEERETFYYADFKQFYFKPQVRENWMSLLKRIKLKESTGV